MPRASSIKRTHTYTQSMPAAHAPSGVSGTRTSGERDEEYVCICEGGGGGGKRSMFSHFFGARMYIYYIYTLSIEESTRRSD